MNNTNLRTYAPAELDALEARLALRMTARLTERTADLPQDVSERLRFAPTAGAAAEAPRLEADLAIAAGLKVESRGNVVDGTLEALLADRTGFEAGLLRALELPA